MLDIGCHLSISGGLAAMVKTAVEIRASTLQFFTRNPRGGNCKEWTPEDIRACCALLREHNFTNLIAHAPYTVNPCSANIRVRNFAVTTMRDDLARLAMLPGSMYNFHPGSHVGQGSRQAIKLTADALNAVLEPGQHIMVLIETMAGKGTEIGASFTEIQEIIAHVELADHIGVCLDTCHIHDAGYDIVNNLDDVLAEFDAAIGLQRLQAIHLNDSKNSRGSHKDRHASIGEGYIGIAAFKRFVTDARLCRLPFILETPDDLPGYANEIALLRSFDKT